MTIKKILAAMLTVCILFSVMNIGTFAASNTSISIGEIITASANENYGKLSLEFVPEETATYAFYSMGDCDTCGYIFDSSMNLLCENDDYSDLNFYAVYTMTAGEKYYLKSELYSNDGDGEYSVSVEKVTAAEELIIYHGGETFGYVGNYLYLECIAEPEGAHPGSCIWESDNEDVAIIEYYGDSYCEIYLAGVGQANITVTNGDGVSDTVQITAIEPCELEPDEPSSLSFGVNGGTRYFTFTPDNDGEYAVYTSGAMMPLITVYDSEWESIAEGASFGEGGDVIARAELFAGETYNIEVYTFLESPDFELTVSECVAAEGVEILSYDSTEGYEGMRLYMDAVFSPVIAISEECTWESSNTDVATVNADGTYCEVLLVGEGTATVTVTSETGYTDSVEIICRGMDEIKLDEIKTVTSADGEFYKFIPEKSGNYTFTSESEYYTSAVIFDSNWSFVAFGEAYLNGTEFVAQADMNAWETYYLFAYCEESVYGISFDVTITESTKAKSVTFLQGSEISGYIGEELLLNAVFDSKLSEAEECTFYSSDERVVSIYDYFGTSCNLNLVGEGTATITVKTESGLKAVCTVHADELEYTIISLDEEITVNTETHNNAYFEFTPEEDGVYSFISSGNVDTYAFLLDYDMFFEYIMEQTDFDDDLGEEYNFCLQVEMKAGEHYIFGSSYYDDLATDESYTVKVIKSTKADRIVIDESGLIYGTAGTMIEIHPEFAPTGAEREIIYWRVSDRDVVEVVMEDDYSCVIMLNGDGIATLEAHTDSGLYAEVTVVVGDAVNKGDVNGDGQINAVDTNMLKRYVGGNASDIITLNSDMNDDGSVDSIDSNLLKRLVAGQ